MQKNSFHILRVSMAVTFLWIAVLIFKSPEAWGHLLQPWSLGLLPIPLKEAMIGTAILDVVIGLLLLIDWWVWLVALVSIIHLVMVLTVVGISESTVRDIGLLGASVALFADALPLSIKTKFSFKKKAEVTGKIFR